MNWLQLYKNKLSERHKLGVMLQSSGKEYEEACRELCKRDILFFINNFLWTYDPRPDRKPNHLPFITYDYQDDYIRWRNERYTAQEDGLTDKSRDMGVTWLFLAWDLHHWLFDNVFLALLGSRKEDLVDKSDNPDSLFWKLDYMIDRLPKFLLPKGFNKNEHRKSLILVNPETGNAITGESANADFSRQGRYSVIDFDEFAFWENGYSAWTSAGEATRCRFPISTPDGMSNKFADLRHNSAIKTITLKFDKHPLKDDAWLSKTRLRMTEKEFAQEVMVDYQASGGDLWLPAYNANKQDIELQDPIRPVPEEWYLYGSIDHHSKNPAACHIWGMDYDGCEYGIDERYQGESTIRDVGEWFLKNPMYDRLRYVVADSSLWTKDQEVSEGLSTVLTSRAELLMKCEVMIDGKLKKWTAPLVPGAKGHDLLGRDIVLQLITDKKLKLSPLCKALKWELGEALHWAGMSEKLGMTHNPSEVLQDKDNHAWDGMKYHLIRYPQAPKRPVAPSNLDRANQRMHEHQAELGKPRKVDAG